MSSTAGPLFDRFLETAETVAGLRADVDVELAREVLLEAATLLDNGLALDGLDEHDLDVVIAALCDDLVSGDPGAAVRASAEAAVRDPGDLHDPEGAAAAFLVAAAVLQL